jgi:hypothetical protein
VASTQRRARVVVLVCHGVLSSSSLDLILLAPGPVLSTVIGPAPYTQLFLARITGVEQKETERTVF